MNECCKKWISNDIVRIAGELNGAIEHLFKYCPECGSDLAEIEDWETDKNVYYIQMTTTDELHHLYCKECQELLRVRIRSHDYKKDEN